MSTIKTELLLTGALLLGLLILSYTWYAFASDMDYTDSGVGCVDDCLEPLTVVKGN